MSDPNERTCYVGNLSSKVTDELLEELFTQAGPLERVTFKSSDTNSFALVQFADEESVPFAIEIMDGVKLFDTPIVVKPRNGSQQEVEYKKILDKKRRNDRNMSQSFTPSPLDDRKRDHMGLKAVREDNWRQARGAPPPPPPPPMMMNMMQMPYQHHSPQMDHQFRTPPMPRAQPGYKVPSSMPRASRPVDNWHTPPSNRGYHERSHSSDGRPPPPRDSPRYSRRDDPRDFRDPKRSFPSKDYGHGDYDRSSSYDRNGRR